MTNFVLLGPQRFYPCILQATKKCNLTAPFAAITAGWQERESETEELESHLGSPVRNLSLYQRAEQVFAEAPLLREAIRQHQQTLISLQELYRLRLRYSMQTAHQLLTKKKVSRDLLDPEINDSFEAIQRLDQHHLQRIQALNQAFYDKWDFKNHDVIKKHREDLFELLQNCQSVLISGGHVAVLLNRIRLFGIEPWLLERTCIGWAAGAMVLGEKIVLFHDSPPQGRGYAEIFEAGLGLYSNRLVFPSARKRLMLKDPVRVQLLAWRFATDSCWTLDDHAQLAFVDQVWQPNGATHQLHPDGTHFAEVRS